MSFVAATAVFVRRFFKLANRSSPALRGPWRPFLCGCNSRGRRSGRRLRRHGRPHPRRLLIETSARTRLPRRTHRPSRTACLQRGSAFTRPAICHRHRRYRPFQEIQRYLRPRCWRPGAVHGGQAAIAGRWRRRRFALRWRGSSPSSFGILPPRRAGGIWSRCARSLRSPRFRCVVPKKSREVPREEAIAGQASRIAESPEKENCFRGFTPVARSFIGDGQHRRCRGRAPATAGPSR